MAYFNVKQWNNQAYVGSTTTNLMAGVIAADPHGFICMW